MTYREATQYLDSFINYEKFDNYDYKESFKLDRMRKFAELLGNPHIGIKSIHIAGTKGKGSTAAIVHSILKKSHFKVGLYTSPHLVSFRERIRIDDELISEDDICRLLELIKEAALKMKSKALSFFEAYTALAYLYFKEKKADFAIYEVGLGGRLDATNIISPLVSAITAISYEHTEKLGSTLREIAKEKAGIIKDGGICVSAPQEIEALKAIRNICVERKARLILIGDDILFEELSSNENGQAFNVFGLFGEYPILETRLLGPHQIVNAATAIGVVEALRFFGIIIPALAIREGVFSAKWDGRLEIVGRKPFLVLDGAQNRASANALARAVKKIFEYKDLTLVLGVSKDKDVDGILKELLPISDSVILTKSKVAQRALEPSMIRALINSKDVALTSSVREALHLARTNAGEDDLILVTGSLFVIGEAKEIIGKKYA